MRNKKKNTFGWGIIFLAVFLAGCASYNPAGINCLEKTGDGVIASAANGEEVVHAYFSGDGGMTWEESTATYSEAACEPTPRIYTTDENGHQIVYKLGTDNRFKISEDHQATWQPIHWIDPLTNTEEKLYEVTFGKEYVDPGNVGRGVIDQNTGNLIMTVSVHGVIVMQADGSFIDHPLGPYQRLEYSPLNIFLAFTNHILIIGLIVVITMMAHTLLYNEFFNSIMAAIFCIIIGLAYLLLVVYKAWPVWLGIALTLLFALLLLLRSRLREAFPLTPTLERRKIIIGVVPGLVILLLPYLRVAGDVTLTLTEGFYWYIVGYIITQIFTGLWLMLKPKPRQEIRMRG